MRAKKHKYYTEGVEYLIQCLVGSMRNNEKIAKRLALELCFNEENPFYKQICYDLMKYLPKECPNLKAAKAFDKSELKELVRKRLGFRKSRKTT